jgi:putative transposase
MVKAFRDCFTTSVQDKMQWYKSVTWDGELGFQARMALRELLERSLEQEIEAQLGGLSRYERGEHRLDQRNGYYTRNLDSEMGPIEGLKVPRSRHGVYETELFERYHRRTGVVDEAILSIFCGGNATRRVGEILELLTGASVSAATVSQVVKALDPYVKAYHQRPLEDRYQYLLLDGIALRCKGANGRKTVLVLTAYGITTDGHRELIDFRQETSEGEAPWTRFLQSLYLRGLKGDKLQLVTTDGAAGLIAALDMVFPMVPRQRCWVHKMQNASNKLRKINRKACVSQAQRIYLAPSRTQAIVEFRKWKTRWEPIEPKAVACIADDIEALLAVFDVPEQHWKMVRTNNPIERSFREVRRRTRPMSCFNNAGSIDRIMFAVFAHQNAKWSEHPIKGFTQKT